MVRVLILLRTITYTKSSYYTAADKNISSHLDTTFSRGLSGIGAAAYVMGILSITSTSFVANSADEKGLAIFVSSIFPLSGVGFSNVSFARNAVNCPLGQYGYGATDEVRTKRGLY